MLAYMWGSVLLIKGEIQSKNIKIFIHHMIFKTINSRVELHFPFIERVWSQYKTFWNILDKASVIKAHTILQDILDISTMYVNSTSIVPAICFGHICSWCYNSKSHRHIHLSDTVTSQRILENIWNFLGELILETKCYCEYLENLQLALYVLWQRNIGVLQVHLLFIFRHSFVPLVTIHTYWFYKVNLKLGDFTYKGSINIVNSQNHISSWIMLMFT